MHKGNNLYTIKTPVDELVKLVNKRKMITLKRASKILKVEERIIVSWMTILEDNALAKMRYKMFGEPEIIACS